MEGKGDDSANKKRNYSENDFEHLFNEEKRKRIEAERLKEEAERSKEEERRRFHFINNLVNITSRDALMYEIKLADFDNSITLGGDIAGSGTGSFIKDTESKATSVAGGIQMSKFCRKQVSGMDDEMHVKLIDISLEELLKPLKDRCIKQELDYDTFIQEETCIITKIRATIAWLTLNHNKGICEEVVQSLFMLYADGLLKNLKRNKFSVEKVTGLRLHTNICVLNKKNQIITKNLHGKSDASIMFNKKSSHQTREQKLLHKRSVTIEMKHIKLNGSPAQVAS